MPEHESEPAIPAARMGEPQEPEVETRRFIADMTGGPQENAAKMAALFEAGHRLGVTAMYDVRLPDSAPEPLRASEVLTKEEEEALFAELDKDAVETIEEYLLHLDPNVKPRPPARLQVVSRIKTYLHPNNIITLRDLLMAGSVFVSDITNLGPTSFGAIRDVLVAKFGPEAWLPNPKPSDLARWASKLSQIKGFVISPLYKDRTLQQLVEQQNKRAQIDAAEFEVARLQIREAREHLAGRER